MHCAGTDSGQGELLKVLTHGRKQL